MKLVVCFQEGDGYTYSCSVAQPIEYESEEALLIELEEALIAGHETKKHEIYFAGYYWYYDYMMHEGKADFEVKTIDDWFEQNPPRKESELNGYFIQ